MTKQFLFIGDTHKYEVEISVISLNEDESDAEIESILCVETNEVVDIGSLKPVEQAELFKQAYELAYEYARDAYYEAEQMRGEAMYDAWKHGDFELPESEDPND